MNILFIVPNYYPHIGGVEKHVRELSFELIKDGHTVNIIVQKHDNSYADSELIDSIKVIRLAKTNIKLTRRIYANWQLLNLLNIFKQADIIHFHDFDTMWYIGLIIYPLLKIMRKKICITFHGWEGNVPPKKTIITKRKICEILTDANICVGHFIEKWYHTNADLISYGGVHKARFMSLEGNYILFIGRLAPDTGIMCYIEAWKKISQEYPDLNLVICGDGILKNEIKKYILRNGLKNIGIIGFVTETEKYLANSKIVFTSGYLSILEAFSFRKPVICLYDNELKRDYLQMMPDSNNMMWIAQNSEEVFKCVGDALIDATKVEKAYNFSLYNSWEKVKIDYYSVWAR